MAMTRYECAICLFVPVVLLLAGCEDRVPLSNDKIAAMLRDELTEKCDQQTVYIRAGRFGTGQARRAENWFDNSVLANPLFDHIAQSEDNAGKHGELSYLDDGATFRVSWTQFDRPYDLEANQLSITGCIYAPKRVRIVDVDFGSEDTTARVLFQEEFHYSFLGKQLRDAGLLEIYNPSAPPQSYEYLALFSRSKSGQWRISGVGDN